MKNFHFIVDIEGVHAPDLVGHIQELRDAGYNVRRADLIEHSDGTPAQIIDVLRAVQEQALAAVVKSLPTVTAFPHNDDPEPAEAEAL